MLQTPQKFIPKKEAMTKIWYCRVAKAACTQQQQITKFFKLKEHKCERTYKSLQQDLPRILAKYAEGSCKRCELYIRCLQNLVYVILNFKNIILSSSSNTSKVSVAIVPAKSNQFFLEPCLANDQKKVFAQYCISALFRETDFNSSNFTPTPVSGKK